MQTTQGRAPHNAAVVQRAMIEAAIEQHFGTNRQGRLAIIATLDTALVGNHQTLDWQLEQLDAGDEHRTHRTAIATIFRNYGVL